MKQSESMTSRSLVEQIYSDKPVVMTRWHSPLGPMILAAQAGFLRGVWFEGQKHFAGVADDWIESPADPVLAATLAQLQAYFAQRRSDFDLPLAPHGTPFQRQVWQTLLDIPFATRISYGEVAARMGAGRGVRAVAAAIGRNPISLIIPCHRVVAASGSLTGYAGGLERKAQLLELEACSDATA